MRRRTGVLSSLRLGFVGLPLLVFAMLALTLLCLGLGPVDALLGAAPVLLPSWLRTLPAPARRRRVWVELPVLTFACLGGGLLLAASQAQLLGAPWPWAAGLGFGVYLLGWVVLLRMLRDLLAGLLVRRFGQRAGPLASVGLLVLGFPQLYVGLQTHRIAVAQIPAHSPNGMAAESVSFTSEDGVRLCGTLLRQSGPAPVVVVCHGVGANRAAFFDFAELAAELGCHALAFDFRAHGESGGCVSTFGYREVRDVAAAVQWLRNDPQLASAPVVLVGVSMGAATVLMAAEQVGAAAVLAESSYADLATMVGGQAAWFRPLAFAAPLFVRAIGLATWCQLGFDLDHISPRASLARLPLDVPVVLLHAGADQVIPIHEGQRLASARPGLTLEVFGGAPHGGCSGAAPQRFRRLLAGLVRAAAEKTAEKTADQTAERAPSGQVTRSR